MMTTPKTETQNLKALIDGTLRDCGDANNRASWSLLDIFRLMDTEKYHQVYNWLGTHQESISWTKTPTYIATHGNVPFESVDDIVNGASHLDSYITLPMLAQLFYDLEEYEKLAMILTSFYGVFVNTINMIAVRTLNFADAVGIDVSDVPSPFDGKTPTNCDIDD